ncbi:hypothetical protein M2161_005875 [Streptomyces sp. SAI-133]|uniref:hypothetical protein n=1 Tax=unclassified Streptomyces TaxID=2593676 RepID=UPI0024747BF8|nr:hypothetical protein [Streptomyces sp. SAI-133]MDH6586769.1 hypothetical protein [Streptomyces sp. SAI-133]
MNGWNGYSSGSGAGHGPSEERGRSAWSSGEAGTAPPWASAETQTSSAPPWATAGTQASPVPLWTPAAPGPAHAPHRVRRVFVALAVAVLVGVSVGAGVWWFLRDTSLGSGTPADAGPAPSVTAPSSSSSSSSPSPSASTAAGYRRVYDPVGYSVDVPRGWTRSEKQGRSAPVVVYDAPDDGRRLQVFRIAEDTPAQSLELAENDPGYGFARQPGYRVLDRATGTTWAELVYRYDDADLGARRVVDHRFQAADGTLYAIRSAGPASLTPALVREPLTRALASFCPADTECR